MATRIPLPGAPGTAFMEGINTGSGMFSRMMQPAMQKQQMGMDWQRHLENLALQEAEQQRLAQQFSQDYALRQAQEQRASELFPYQRKNLEAESRYHGARADKASFMQDLLTQFMGQSGQGGMPQPQTMQQPQFPFGQGVGLPDQPAQVPDRAQTIQGLSGNKVHPFVAAQIKKETGWDPNSLNPYEKQQMELDTHAKKQGIEVGTAKVKERSKLEEQYRADNLQSLEDAHQSLSDINQVNDLLGQPGTQQYEYATSALGPLDSKMPALRTGTRLFRGEFERLAGRLKSNIARLEKGATSDKERAMIDKAEISDSDTWTTAKGKLNAQEKYLKNLINRKKIIADLLDQGHSREESLNMAMKQAPLDPSGGSQASSSLEDPLGIR